MKKILLLSIMMLLVINTTYAGLAPIHWSTPPARTASQQADIDMSLLYAVALFTGYLACGLIGRKVMALKPKLGLAEGVFLGLSAGITAASTLYFHSAIASYTLCAHLIFGFVIGIATAPQRKLEKLATWLWKNNMIYSMIHH